MKWFNKFFPTKRNLTIGNELISAIEFDHSKYYVLVVKAGVLSQREWRSLVAALPGNVHVTWSGS